MASHCSMGPWPGTAEIIFRDLDRCARLKLLDKQQLGSCLFCRSVATYQHMAIISFAENGRFSGPAKDWFMIFGFYNQENCVLLNQLFLFGASLS
jgi:hypothetical protein